LRTQIAFFACESAVARKLAATTVQISIFLCLLVSDTCIHGLDHFTVLIQSNVLHILGERAPLSEYNTEIWCLSWTIDLQPAFVIIIYIVCRAISHCQLLFCEFLRHLLIQKLAMMATIDPNHQWQ